jgi:murein DD-endopeptidase MepM/ murein hydrolase activator NlpD
MAKVKYYFDHHTLSFKQVQKTFRTIILKILSYFSTSLVFAVVFIIFGFYYFDSPKEKVLQREVRQYELQYRLLNDRLNNIQAVLKDLADRDDNIYRVIFEAEPIPGSTRKAGYGGTDRYKDLEGYKNSDIIMESTKRIDQITAELYVQSKSFDEVYDMAKNKACMLASLPAIQPVNNKDLRRLSSYFGYRIDPYYKVTKFHEGVDFSAPVGTDIHASGDGVVIERERSMGGYGNVIIIDHGFGYKTMYAHIQEFKINLGDHVKRGEIIATVGSTGKSTSPHCHYEVWKNNKPINPINYFFNDLTPAQYDEVLLMSSRPSQSMD